MEMNIRFKGKEDYLVEVLEEDVEAVKESLYELKRSIIALEKLDNDNEIYHRYCDVEDEVINLIDTIIPKGALN